mgnify:CR=1 FL=1
MECHVAATAVLVVVVVAAAAQIRSSDMGKQAMMHPDLREVEAVAPPAVACKAMLFG